MEQYYSRQSDFVPNVSFNDSVILVVGLDKQSYNIDNFCACEDPTHASVLGVDAAFNLGNFFVTPTTYEHKLLRHRKSGKHPVLIGPTYFIYQNRKRTTPSPLS